MSWSPNRFGPNDPTGEGCLPSHRLPQAAQLALFLPISSPHGYAVCVPARAAYSNSASDSNRYDLPVIRDSHAAYCRASSHVTLMTGCRPRPKPPSLTRGSQSPCATQVSQSLNVTSNLATANG